MTLSPTLTTPVLSDEQLETFASRAPVYDRENRFFQEDFEDLRRSGYLVAAVPAELGGGGFNIKQMSLQQRRLAERAPATAVALNMHHYWVGLAADLVRMGDTSVEWILKEAARGEIFAAGHGETGNDVPLALSTTRAERVDGGYRFYGHKIFGSLSPVWTRLGVHGMDATNPEGPVIVHAFIPRDADGYTIKETWDTLGMRATKSDDTILDGVFVPDQYVARVLPAGAADMFILGINAWALLGFGSVYLGIARRALDLAVETAHRRTSLALSRSMAYHPEVQHTVAEMAMEYEAMEAHLDRTLDDWAAGVEHGGRWPLKIVSTKHRVVEGAKKIVDGAISVSGGSGFFKRNELERLYRDVRAGGLHPANTLLTPELVGKIALGIDPGEQPRWG